MSEEKAQSAALGFLAVALPSAAALTVLARAYAYYQGRDGVAGFIVLLMGVGLLVGIGELVMRIRRSSSLHRELVGMSRSPSELDVERASPGLRAMLRARLEHAPMPVYGESITAYLVGLMVMLGLLGTLLGLFETLGGAGRALTASSNVEALRSGLSGPMQGLTRSFGCSAAGVAASAMLGLASVLVKRRELSLVAAVQRYAAGALRELSPLRRQLNALERLAEQGSALPNAAAALSGVGDRIDALSKSWESTLVQASKAQEDVIRGAFGGLRERVEAAAQAAASSLEAQLAPVLKNSAQTTERAAREHLVELRKTLAQDLARKVESEALATKQAGEALTALADKLSQSLSSHGERTQAGFTRLFAALEARDAEHRAALEARDAEHRAALLAEREAVAQSIAAQRSEATLQAEAQRREAALQAEAQRSEAALQVEAQRSEAAAHVAALGEAARALLSQLDDEAKARRAEAGHLLGELAEKLDAASRERAAQSREELQAIANLGERMAGDVDTREKARSSAWTELAERVVQMAASTRSEEEARLSRLDTLASRIGADLGQLAAAMEKQLETRMEAETALGARSRDTLAIVERSAEALGNAITEQRAALDTLLEASAGQLAELGEKAQAGAVRALARIGEVADEQGQRFAALSAQIGEAHTAQATGLANELNAHAELLTKELAGQTEKLQAGVAGTSKLVDDAAQLLHATSAELSAVAEMFGKSVERQRETAKTWLDSMGELEGVIERVGRGAAADALGDQLASTQEVFARQLQFQRELFEQLRSLRGMPGASGPARGEHDVSA